MSYPSGRRSDRDDPDIDDGVCWYWRYTDWRIAWRDLSADGVCDEIDGVEYRRVTRAWIAAGAPAYREGFIRRTANRAASE